MLYTVIGVTLLIAGFILLVVGAAEDLGVLGIILVYVLMFGGIALGAISPCPDCGFSPYNCTCSEMVCVECGQTLPKKNKEYDHKEPVGDPNKCCNSCGQKIVVNIEINCEHAASVESETTPETVTPETARPVVPSYPKCNKGVTSAFCPNCGYDMYASVVCSSCDKEFKPNEAPSYCSDCGRKIPNN